MSKKLIHYLSANQVNIQITKHSLLSNDTWEEDEHKSVEYPLYKQPRAELTLQQHVQKLHFTATVYTLNLHIWEPNFSKSELWMASFVHPHMKQHFTQKTHLLCK